MSYFIRKWQVLMWKNLIVRRRHWFLTLFEIVIPILLFWALAWMRQNDIFGQKAIVHNETIYPVYSEEDLNDNSFVFHDFVKIAYAPDTPFTQNIIKEFNKTFVAKLQKKGKLESFNVFATELEMEEYFHQQYENKSVHMSYSGVGFGIVFENLGNDSKVPKDFKYKIRSTKSGWNTKDLFPQFLPAGPSYEGDYYVSDGFLAIQLAIDIAYIQVARGGSEPPSTYEINIQKFPFPQYKVDMFNTLFKTLMPLFTMLSFITISISVLKKVVEEKTSGVNELMKMMGLRTWMVWAGWVLNGLLVYIVTCIIITFLLCHEFDSEKDPVIAYVHFTIVFVQFLLFCLGSIFFCFAISAFFMRPTIAMVAGMTLWMVSYAVLMQYIGKATMPFGLQLLLCLVPIYNMCTGYVVIAAFESRGISINWLNLFSSAAGGNDISLGIVLIMFFVQMAFYMFVTWYVTSIHPGPYGRAQPWYFIFKFPSKRDKRRDAMMRDDDDSYERYESPPRDLSVGLKIHELRKVFSNGVVAVDRVNLDIYEGEITALLGHNGAGKTTTMSILTGMYSPSSGSVYAKDYNIFENMDRFRNSLGLCPQHDLLFPYLTAIEHLIFFGMLKGMKMRVARSEGMKLLQMLHVSEKRNVLSDKLSGGMKRKLSLAIALIGSPKVLVLDEPTSGMDPESRREMWDLLLSLRGDRTILITTHFMEEADVLGDRIAIMDHGTVKCYGTTLFLKRIYGTGYQLTMTKKPEFPLEAITNTIKGSVAGAELKNAHTTQVTYSVPQEAAAKMPRLFTTIEREKGHLGVTGVGISCTTMEEVFLKVGQLAREEKYEFDKNGSQLNHPNPTRNTSNEALTYKKRKGLPLMIQQFTSLVHKRSLFTLRRPIASTIFFVVPLLLTWFTIKNGLVDVLKGLKEPPFTLSLSEYGETEAFVSGPADATDLYQRLIKEQGSKATVVDSDPGMVKYLLDLGKANVVQYKTLDIVAASFVSYNDTVVALYNGIAYHAAPISVNVLSNLLLRNQTQTSGNTITTVNHPLDLNNFMGSCSALNDLSLWMGALMWLILIPMGVKAFLVDFITFPHNERTSNAKQLQLMTGVAPHVYWASCFTWDFFVYLVSCTAMFIIILLFDTSALFTEGRDYGVLLLILVLYGVSGISCTYLYSFLGKSSNMAGTIFTFVTLVTGVILPPIMHFLLRLSDPTGTVIRSGLVNPLHYLLCLEPQYAFGSAILNFAYLLSEHSGCKQCDNSNFMAAQGVCDDKPYLEFASEKNPNGLLEFVLYLSMDWMVCLLVILLVEYGYMSQALHWLKVQWVGKDFNRLPQEDSDVRDERDRVDAARLHRGSPNQNRKYSRPIELAPLLSSETVSTPISAKSTEYMEVKELRVSKNRAQDDSVVLTVDSLAKKFSRSFAAVQGISFRVSAGECFGLLGVNGAGKTTTFRMLTGDETPTAGEARVLHYDLVKNRSKYLSQIGYCPQFDGINGFLTGEEMLQLFANLRGIPQSQIQPQVNEWISLLGLEEYRGRKCGKYSGGNKRKLSTAMALIGDPPVVFLDEPTTGVDPVARRNLWDVLMRCQKSGQAIVLTSHSMEECEALCTRLTIMVRGRMKCIGSNQYLRQRYGQGYTIMIKLHTYPNQDQLLARLIEDMATSFSSECTLKDQHKSLLHYHISDTSILLSELFSVMEHLKLTHSLMEDYTVGDTTLEQVFIAFARQTET